MTCTLFGSHFRGAPYAQPLLLVLVDVRLVLEDLIDLGQPIGDAPGDLREVLVQQLKLGIVGLIVKRGPHEAAVLVVALLVLAPAIEGLAHTKLHTAPACTEEAHADSRRRIWRLFHHRVDAEGIKGVPGLRLQEVAQPHATRLRSARLARHLPIALGDA